MITPTHYKFLSCLYIERYSIYKYYLMSKKFIFQKNYFHLFFDIASI